MSPCTDSITAANRVTCNSNGGNLISLFAPGALIVAGSQGNNPDGTPFSMGGTSQAAPHVAGALAVLRSAYNADTVAQGESRVINSNLSVVDHRNAQTKPRLDVTGSLAGAHYDVTQQLYIGFYGRPADASGLAYWAVMLSKGASPTTIAQMSDAYGSNATVKAVTDAFANASESTALYGGDVTTFVTAVYRNVLNRDPDAGGLAFWRDHINAGDLTRAQAVLGIMGSAMQYPQSDGLTVVKKTQVAKNFTTAVDTNVELSKYSGLTANQKARSMLSQVSASTDVTGFQPTVESTISSL